VVVVDRSASPYGAGWGIVGVSGLVTGLSESRMMLIEGDGSYQLFQQDTIDTSLWRGPDARFAPNEIRLDTYGGACAGLPTGSHYIRELKEKTTLLYDTGGSLRWVVDRLCHRTEISYNGSRITEIRVPPYEADLRYVLAYDANGKLDSVTDPAGRVMDVTVEPGSVEGFDLTAFQDPGHTATIQINYDSEHRATRWTSRRGHSWRYLYHQLFAPLIHSARDPKGNATLFTPIRKRGLAAVDTTVMNTAVDTTLHQVEVDGPRGDVSDVWTLKVDDLLQPTEMTNPNGDVTTITYSAALRLLPTQVDFPGGRTMTAVYNTRGNPTSVTDNAPGVTGTTSYTWDTTWPDMVSRITTPTSEVYDFTYDAATGNRLTQVDQRGSASQVNFRYYSSGPETGLLRATDPPGTVPADSVVYDSIGNVDEVHSPTGLVTSFNARPRRPIAS